MVLFPILVNLSKSPTWSRSLLTREKLLDRIKEIIGKSYFLIYVEDYELNANKVNSNGLALIKIMLAQS